MRVLCIALGAHGVSWADQVAAVTDHAADHAADHGESAVANSGQHDHSPPHSPEPDALQTGHAHHGSGGFASLAVVVANYDLSLFRGNYQGAIVGAGWQFGRFGLAANLPIYRLRKNGLLVEGVGDVMAHAHVTAVTSSTAHAGFTMMVSAPTGDASKGLGMGHVMVMPGGWGAWRSTDFMIAGTLMFHRALGGGSAHAAHGGGMWPLVDPMTATEVAGSITGMYALARSLAIGVHADGAIPLEETDERFTVGVRAVWVSGRTETSLGIDRGVVGQPFGLRGTLAAAVRFH